MEIISRKDAKELGLKTYFTGVPCKYGHIALRHVSSLQCATCSAERCRTRYHADPEKARRRSHEYREKNAKKVAESLRRYRSENAEKRASSWKRYYDENKQLLAAKSLEYRRKNRDAVLEGQRTWREKNTAARTSLEGKRRAAKRNAIPAWFGELDDLVWREAADLVRRRHVATGIKWASDHMVPLRAKTACGLHVARNCQVIPSGLNGWKHNRMVLTQPMEWLNFA